MHFLLFLLFSLTLLRRLIRQNPAFPNSADKFHNLLGLILGRKEAPLGFRGTTQGCSRLAPAYGEEGLSIAYASSPQWR
jgi:hypothetical protein